MLYVLCGFYAFLILQAIKGWRKGVKSKVRVTHSTAPAHQGFSVLIPFRNEALNLPALLSNLGACTSVSHDFEILFIDDSSTDEGPSIINEWTSAIPYTILSSDGEGKKEAIRTGTRAANYDVIVTLDSDVRLGKEWLSHLDALIQKSESALIILPVIPSPSRSLVGGFATMEYMALVGATFSSAALDRPIMASGAGLVFNRTLLSVDQNGKASGDDMFLLHLAKEKSLPISYSIATPLSINVAMPNRFNEFWSQRSRWTAKSSDYSDSDTNVVAWITLIFNLTIAVLLFSAAFGFIEAHTAVAFFSFKFILDFIFLYLVYSHYNRRGELWTYPIFALVYPFYVPILAISSQFNAFQWKGRTHQK